MSPIPPLLAPPPPVRDEPAVLFLPLAPLSLDFLLVTPFLKLVPALLPPLYFFFSQSGFPPGAFFGPPDVFRFFAAMVAGPLTGPEAGGAGAKASNR